MTSFPKSLYSTSYTGLRALASLLMGPSYPAVTSLAGSQYFIHPQILGKISESTAGDSSVTPYVVISTTSSIDERSVLDTLTLFSRSDDVYQEPFGQSLILQTLNRNDPLFAAGDLSLQKRFRSFHHWQVDSEEDLLPSGPYFVQNGEIHQAWRIYPDELHAFVVTVIPDDVKTRQRYSPLEAIAPGGIHKAVAVPSRLYARKSAKQPLAGSRVALKDCYHLAGIQTTMSSKAFTELYGPEQTNADFVNKLIELGATVVGKTKMTNFASSDEPTDQWIDDLCPTNPRGDLYQSPSGSSTGAAAALAGYDWLDHSIGADTGGSIRAPATANGLFSIRTSWNSTSMAGIQEIWEDFDVVGVFGRQLQSLREVLNLTHSLNDCRRFPSKILYPEDFFPHSNPTQQAMVDSFVSELERVLGVKATKFSFVERWQQCTPEEADNKPLNEYLAKSAFWPMCHAYNNAFAKFRDEYESKFYKKPYIGPVARFRWAIGAEVSVSEYKKGREELRVFREWFDANVLTFTSDTLSDAILIMPYGMGGPKYRDAPNEAPSTSNTVGEKFLSPILGIPQLVIPIGQNPYQSRVSGREEYRPIAATILGARGSDLMLINLAEEVLQSAGWPTEVQTGRFTFKVGKNTRNAEIVGEPAKM